MARVRIGPSGFSYKEWKPSFYPKGRAAEEIPGLGERLGILLFQLPPNFKCDNERLETFLGALTKKIP